MASIAEASSLFEIDVELDGLVEEIEGQVESEGQAAEDLVARFQQFCEAHGEKVDRIGRFIRTMEAREQYCRSEAARLADRARAAAGKVERTKNMVLYYLLSRDLKKIEGYPLTLAGERYHCLFWLFLSCAGLLRGRFFLLICCGWKSVSRGWPLASLDELSMIHKAF